MIFITENDVLYEYRLISHIDRYITESGSRFDDGAQIIYVNASFREKRNSLKRNQRGKANV